MLPKFVVTAAGRLLAKAPPRYRGIARTGLIVAAALFVAFEASRFWLVARDYVLPMWRENFGTAAKLADDGNWLALLIAAVAFCLPFAAFIWAMRRFTAWKAQKAISV